MNPIRPVDQEPRMDNDTPEAPAPGTPARRAYNGVNRPGVKRDDVFAACEELLRAGERPSVERVRMHIGSGSPNTITPHVNAWFETLPGRLRPVGVTDDSAESVKALMESTGLDDAVIESFHSLWKLALRRSGQAWRAEVDASRAEVEADRATLREAEADLADRQIAFEAASKGLEEALATTREALASSQRQAADVEAQRTALAAQLEEAHTNLLQATRRVETMRGEFDAAGVKHAAALREQQARHDAQEKRHLLEVDRAREEARAATAATAKEVAKNAEMEARALEAATAAAGAQAELQREAAQLRAALEAAQARAGDATTAHKLEAEAHQETKALLRQALDAVSKGPAKAVTAAKAPVKAPARKAAAGPGSRSPKKG